MCKTLISLSIKERLIDLETLDLSYAATETLDKNTFQGLNNMKVMNLSHNPLTNLNNQLARLKTLKFSYNQLTNLNNMPFEGLISLKELFLSHNRLTNLNNQPFEGLTSLKVIK